MTDAVQMGLIQGKKPRSKEEWFVFLALTKLKHEFNYQFAIKGGSIRGGFWIDYVVWTAMPFTTALEVKGRHWHQGQAASKDKMREREIKHLMGWEVKEVWDDEAFDEESAYMAVKKAVGSRV